MLVGRAWKLLTRSKYLVTGTEAEGLEKDKERRRQKNVKIGL